MATLFASDASEREQRAAQALLDSLNKEAAVARGMWIAFNSLAAFLAISVLGVTHEDLLLDRPLVLPLLNASIPLSWFAVIGPALLLVVHFSVLIEHGLLARKAVALNEILNNATGKFDSEKIRMGATTYFFAQNIVAPLQNRFLMWGMRAISWLTLDIFPLLLLLLFQLQFLPLQNQFVTNSQRVSVLAGALLVGIYGLVRRQPTMRLGDSFKKMRRDNHIAWVALVVLVLSSPGLAGLTIVGAQERGAWHDFSRYFPGTWLFDKARNEITGRQVSWFSQNLIVNGIDIKEEKFKDLRSNLRGRNLIGADFSYSKLQNVDFTAANLRGADFSGSDLIRSRFGCANRVYVKKKNGSHVSLDAVNQGDATCTKLIGADLTDAKLAFASMIGVDVEGASFQKVDLRLTDMYATTALAADFRGAKLRNVGWEKA